MNIYAYISIYIGHEVLSRESYKLTNKDGVYCWKYVRLNEARSIRYAYQISIKVASTDRPFYNCRAPDIPFDNKHLECPVVERGKW